MTLKKGARRLGEEACFSLAAEGKVLDFAVPSTVPDDGKSGQVHHVLLRQSALVPYVPRRLLIHTSDAVPISRPFRLALKGVTDRPNTRGEGCRLVA